MIRCNDFFIKPINRVIFRNNRIILVVFAAINSELQIAINRLFEGHGGPENITPRQYM